MKKIVISLLLVCSIIFLSCPAITLASDAVSVTEAMELDAETSVTVEGIFVGVADETPVNSATNEMLIKDLSSDAIISVRNVPYGTFPDYGYKKGDKLSFLATVKVSDDTYNTGKKYLDFSSDNGTIDTTIVSSGNQITYDLDDAVSVSSWSQMQSLFTVDALEHYSYFKFTGTSYINYYTSGDTYRPHKNASATALADIKPDGTHTLALNNDVMTANIGSDWKSLFFDTVISGYPGTQINKTFYAVYTGADQYRFYFAILDEGWVQEPTYTNADIIKEVAYAYRRQGGQIEYDQYNSRRHISPSPEDATAQHRIYLDCSSYVNACYIEAFGESILPASTGLAGSTVNYNSYAKDNPDNADVIGYWEPADYPTDEEKSALADSIISQLQVGDILTYRHGTATTTKGHVYIYVGNDTFLHRTGAGSYTVNTSNPALSYDMYATEQTLQHRQIDTISVSTIFTDTENDRYIFKATTSDTVKSFCLLRPLARNLTPTQESLNRMKIAGLVMEKISSVYENSSVCPDDIITYTVTLQNTSSAALQNVTLTDTLPTGTEFVSGSDGISVSGQALSWTGSVASGKTVTVTYDVKVTASVPGTLIESNATYVGGVKLGNITHSVSTYSDMHRLTLTTKAAEYVANQEEFNSNLDMAISLYRDALGINLTEYDSPEAMLDELIDSENYTCRTDTELSKMLVPHLFGGLDIAAGHYTIPDNERARLISEGELAVGDIILAEWSGGNIVYVYAGNSSLLTYEDGKPKGLTIGENIYGEDADNILVSLYAYDRYAVLRPSMTNETPTVAISSIVVTTPPTKLVYKNGESFDQSGMVVSAIMSNGMSMEITSYTTSPNVLTYGETSSVTVSFGELSTTFDVTVTNELRQMGVAEASALEAGNIIEVEGYYVGVTREGASSTYEMVIKDVDSDTFLSVRNVTYGTFPDYGYKNGDRIRFAATVSVSDDTYTSGKKYLDFSASNGEIDSTIISRDNKITYSLENAVTVSSWSQVKSKYTNGDIDYYTIVKFTDTTYMNYSYNTYRFHKNSAAATTADARITGTRILSLRTELMEANVGADLDELLGITAADTWPGASTSKTFYALFTGGSGYYFDHIILDKNWIIDDFSIAQVSDDGKTVGVNVAEAGTYSVIFADYDYNTGNLLDYDIKEITVTQPDRVNVTTDKNMSFAQNDKIMFWKDLTTLIPLCSPHIFE